VGCCMRVGKGNTGGGAQKEEKRWGVVGVGDDGVSSG